MEGKIIIKKKNDNNDLIINKNETKMKQDEKNEENYDK